MVGNRILSNIVERKGELYYLGGRGSDMSVLGTCALQREIDKDIDRSGERLERRHGCVLRGEKVLNNDEGIKDRDR